MPAVSTSSVKSWITLRASWIEREHARFARALGHALKYTGKHVGRADGERLATARSGISRCAPGAHDGPGLSRRSRLFLPVFDLSESL